MFAVLIKIQDIINGGDETVRQHQYANSLNISESTVMQNNYRGNDSTNGHSWNYWSYPVFYVT